MKIDTRILNPDRNTTPHLWKRLHAGAMMPIFCITPVIIATNLLRQEDGMSRGVGIGVIVLMIVIAFGSSLGQKRLISELEKRCSEVSNKDLNPISEGRGRPSEKD